MRTDILMESCAAISTAESTWAYLAAVADVVLREPHVVIEVREDQLRLNHPEFSQVAGGERVLGTERRAERVHVRERACANLSLQLT